MYRIIRVVLIILFLVIMCVVLSPRKGIGIKKTKAMCAGLLSLLFIWDGSALEWYYPSTSPRLYPGFSF